MEPKIFTQVSVIILAFTLTRTVVKAGDDSQLVVEARNETIKQTIPINRIVIQSVLDNYDRPTLKDYEECFQNAENCKKVCSGVLDVKSCLQQCPICPELIVEPQLVQGVNDTQIMPSKPLNTTNIIRLTNQIHNVIDNSSGNITLNTDNTVNLHQNVSIVGGKYGLGYNNSDPCCIILQLKRICNNDKFSTSSHCHHKRHRVCGKQCKSRVMVAKRVTVCNQQTDPFDYFEENSESCQQIIRYVPYQSRPSHKRQTNGCSYIPSWPFVTCPQKRQQIGRNCEECRRITYEFILSHGIPLQCNSCFNANGRTNFNEVYMYRPYPQVGWYPPMGPGPVINPPTTDNDIDFGTNNGWREDRNKCILPDGNISDNCIEFDDSGNDNPVTYSTENDY